MRTSNIQHRTSNIEQIRPEGRTTNLNLSPASWAAFLATSWTWCIGMFLPVLLFRDYGLRGFLIFAVPNMIGAAAMGAVLRNSEMSLRLVRAHGAACVAFSTVTILFHAFFIAWVARGLIGPSAPWITVALALGMLGLASGNLAVRVLAVWVFALSLAAFAAAFFLSRQLPPAAASVTTKPAIDLIGLTAVCAFGFALNPYLDLTFHRARQSTRPHEGSAAFGVGFLLFFPLMILFTLWYAPRLSPDRWALVPTALAGVIAAHWMIQTAFTVAVHARGIAAHYKSSGAHPAMLTGGIAAAVLIAGAMGLPFVEREREVGEFVYRLFMFFYALPFPAYVWLCMRPLRNPRPILDPRRFVVFLITVALTTPLFWLAFFGGKMVLLAPAVGIVFLSRYVTGGTERIYARGY